MNKIKQLRQEKGITQKELGDILSVQKAAISKYELGRATPSTDILKKMADYFNVSLDYLLDYTPALSPTANQSSRSTKTTEYSVLVQKIPDLQEAIKLYSTLDPYDRSEIRGEMKGMLRNPKYKPLIKEKTMG